ncbi:MAG: ribosome biogenesis GTPase Der [Deltaproteobacteria bacterium RIFCSPLOWO2_02_56_12]|nr:MAG: ribosome biogenesis GTPase Der [Deltaproteobacteria bacterium RIFCSPLOWO2_02_56_12]OGQ90802.1 MAG: ribosome biogenesis GTPase Der [Deltaproteobacteria bacterium RIFOXYA2_FULL_55_11]
MAKTPQLKTHHAPPLPRLAIVGRPNAGKSTLFNRLAGERKAIVDNLPGVTRDRNYGEVEWYGKRFLLIDTGGFEPDPEKGLKKRIQEQSRLAVEEADVILFLFDGKVGLNPLDQEAVKLLRQVKKPVFFAVNKIDAQSKEDRLYEFYDLGLNEVFPLSAEHGLGLTELMDQVVSAFPAGLSEVTVEEEEEIVRPLRLAIVGRPNVGKSTLVNRLLGFERSVVDSLPGTTRDAVDSPFIWRGQRYTLVDTAGIRRKARIDDRIEHYSVIRSLGSVDRGDLVIHLLDGSEGVTDQDAQILAYAFQRGKGLVLAVNKWDLVPRDSKNTKAYGDQIYRKLSFVDFAPLVFISALDGHGIQRMMEAVQRVARSCQRRIQTSPLNQALRDLFQRHSPPLAQGRQVKLFYATQTALGPPTFTLFVNTPKGITPDYQRYLIHHLRQALELEGSPIRLVLRARREERLKGSRNKGKKR